MLLLMLVPLILIYACMPVREACSVDIERPSHSAGSCQRSCAGNAVSDARLCTWFAPTGEALTVDS